MTVMVFHGEHTGKLGTVKKGTQHGEMVPVILADKREVEIPRNYIIFIGAGNEKIQGVQK